VAFRLFAPIIELDIMPLHNSLIVALLGAILCFPAAAQEQSDAVFRADTRLVLLHASVVDKHGNLVTNLPKSAFKVYDDGKEQQIRIFRREDVPVSLGLIIDNSGSMRDKRGKVEAAALALVKASNPEDQVFIVNFNDEAYLDVPFTNDIKRMQEGLAKIDSRGGTAMRDALSMSIDYLKEKGKRDKKVLLIVTDGNDNTSMITLEKLVEKAQKSEVLIYAVGLLNQEERRERKRAERALKALTVASGGLAHYPKEVDEVEEIAVQVAHEIRNQYIIAYSPTEQKLDGSFHRIKVDVKGPNRPTVRTRTGYYATPDQGSPSAVSQAARPQP
jgi:Ca-activated chloride channel family protein